MSSVGKVFQLNLISALKVSQIRYLQVFENERVSIGLFLLHNGAELPLHNHPGMTVVRCGTASAHTLGLSHVCGSCPL